MYLKCFLVLSATYLVAAYRASSMDTFYKESRIIGGVDEVIENVPWLVSLQYRGKHHCGGSIYSENIIITAAHCLQTILPKKLLVRVGSTNHNMGGTLVGVAEAIIHERFAIPDNDIAILRLNETLTFGTSVKSIALAIKTPRDGTKATTTGWGCTGKLNDERTNLQSAQLKIFNKQKCAKYIWTQLTKNMVCAFSWGKGPCFKDSGGPLVSNGELVGVVSFGSIVCMGPTVFADVAVLSGWILEAVKKLQSRLNNNLNLSKHIKKYNKQLRITTSTA